MLDSTEKFEDTAGRDSNELIVNLYQGMLKSRMIEEKMLILLRQGKISKWFSGIGQEAIAIGVTMALHPQEYILPMHRNLGVFTSRNIPLYRLFGQWQGKTIGFTEGRDRSFHFGTQEHRIIGMISHLGPQMGVACGIALADVLSKDNKVTTVFTGDGGTSEGDAHEAMNIASVWKLPVLFCIENNGYGLSTPSTEQYHCEHLVDRGRGYGMEAHIVEGNNVLEVYHKVSEIVQSMRERPRPILLEFKTFRVRGHEEASGTTYVPEEVLQYWKDKDPLVNFEQYIVRHHHSTQHQIEEYKVAFKKEIDLHWEQALHADAVIADTQKEVQAVYAYSKPVKQHIEHDKIREIRFIDAISEALKNALYRFENLVIMGQDIAEYGGVFKITEGFVELFGTDRIRNTPICESGIVATAYGLAIQGFKAIVEMQFADFVSSGFNPIVNLLAKSHYRWGQTADVVIRMPCGGGVGAGPFHSQTNEAWFTKTPGLKVIYPAFPYDAKGLLIAAIEDPNPILFFEHKKLYRSIRQEVPEEYYRVPLGKASYCKKGNDISIISYGVAVHWALELLETYPNINADLIDLRTLQPLDEQTIYESVRKTGKVIIVHEDTIFGGIASDISALIMEHCFTSLDAPVRRVGSLETPVPFANTLEENYLGKKRFEETLLYLLQY